jgi:hypothetical protein
MCKYRIYKPFYNEFFGMLTKKPLSAYPVRGMFLILILPGFLFLPLSCRDQGQGSDTMHRVEETLTASDPILRLMSSAETGIDFINRIVETYENNITTNINMYNGGDWPLRISTTTGCRTFTLCVPTAPIKCISMRGI